MQEERKNIQKQHNVIMRDCEKLSLTGVNDVGSFDEHLIICYTDFGETVIKGNCLHVENMNVENGDMEVSGKITALIYTGGNKKSSVFSKLFK